MNSLDEFDHLQKVHVCNDGSQGNTTARRSLQGTQEQVLRLATSVTVEHVHRWNGIESTH
jgi:hypothetical protein